MNRSGDEGGSTRVPFGKYDAMGAYHWDECDRRSKRYNPPLEARYEIVAQRAPAHTTALDLGCGDGYLAARLRRPGALVVGVDPEPMAVRLAAQKLGGLGGAKVLRAESSRLPFAGGSFDLVSLTDVIEHLPDPDACLAEIARVLTPNGRLLLTTPKRRPDRVWDVEHVHEYDPGELRARLEGHFAEVRLSYFWPLHWSNLYATRVGWRLLRLWARHVSNPFLAGGTAPEGFGQILAECRQPRRDGRTAREADFAGVVA